ncbi:hypothetical protein [Pontibacter vulgaris]|uniref:hypothetical protein n=1 Tax=Pontibacter vulgaris TaxID=2905679 RepID=UPI001FA6D1FE|nr:hypothetical protein [Pontibacter vulgaris]
MIKRIPVKADLISTIETYLKSHNLGNRGVEDGSKRKQLVGLIGELLTQELLHGRITDLNEKLDGFDGGYDILYKGYKIDVKTMERKSYVRPNYVNNFYILQEEHDADIIVFCSYHSTDNVLEVCGWIPKNELSKRGIFYAAGTKRLRTDGSFFNFRQDNYEVENKDLYSIETLTKINPKSF